MYLSKTISRSLRLHGLCCTALFLVISFRVSNARIFSAERSIIYGPGLKSNLVLPVRYFYIQAVDDKGKNMSSSLGKDAFDINIGPTGERGRIWKELLDRGDGTYIVRFRLYATYDDLNIEIRRNGKQVGKSPFKLKGPIYHEGCDCPTMDESGWSEIMSCPSSFKQIEEDLAQFPSIDLKRLRQEGLKRFDTSGALVYYSIIDNKIYRKTHGEIVGFTMFSDAFLLSLARKVNLPDVEFFLNLGDWPLEKNVKDPLPIFSWCGSDDSADIVMPTYDLTESTLESLGRVSLDMMSVQANTGPRWKQKDSRALWRGRDSRQERLDLVVMGRKKPELYDVGLTNFFFFPHDENLYGPKAQHISFFDFFKYKYQITLDGTVAAYRFPYLLAGDSLVLKQDSPYYEHFYKELEPWKHYVPFKRDLSDLEEKLLWAKSHEKEAKKMAQAAQTYARDNLMADRLYCYYYLVFKEYAKRLKQKPKVLKGMEHIKQPNDRDSECKCRRKQKKSKSAKKRDEL